MKIPSYPSLWEEKIPVVDFKVDYLVTNITVIPSSEPLIPKGERTTEKPKNSSSTQFVFLPHPLRALSLLRADAISLYLLG